MILNLVIEQTSNETPPLMPSRRRVTPRKAQGYNIKKKRLFTEYVEGVPLL